MFSTGWGRSITEASIVSSNHPPDIQYAPPEKSPRGFSTPPTHSLLPQTHILPKPLKSSISKHYLENDLQNNPTKSKY